MNPLRGFTGWMQFYSTIMNPLRGFFLNVFSAFVLLRQAQYKFCGENWVFSQDSLKQ